MPTRLLQVLTAAALLTFAATSHAQQGAKFNAPRTPWGDPDLQGSYSNKDENGTPFERPADLAGKTLSDFGEKELAELRKTRQARAQACVVSQMTRKGACCAHFPCLPAAGPWTRPLTSPACSRSTPRESSTCSAALPTSRCSSSSRTTIRRAIGYSTACVCMRACV